MAYPDRKFRPDVEGLRAVAVGLVVLCHAEVPGFAGGYIGVDVFFVLSGFLITGLLMRERGESGKTSLAAFYGRRARRILPAASLVLLVTVLASYEWLGFLRGDAIAEDGKWTALFAANLHFAAEGTQYLGSTAPPSPLQHYWSLAVEEQFYLFWPLVFLVTAMAAPRVGLGKKLAAVLAATIIASFAFSVAQTSSDPVWAFFSPLTRTWELAAGSLLAVVLPHMCLGSQRIGPALSWTGLGAILAGAFLFDNATSFPGYAAALPVGGTVLVLVGTTIAPRAGAERLLGVAPLQLLGKWSYALYLWHWPLLIIPAERAGESLTAMETAGWMALALVLAAGTHYAFENPIRFARPLARSPWASISVGACLVVGAYGVCAWQLTGDDSTDRPVQVAPAELDWRALRPAATATAGHASATPTPERINELLSLVSAASLIEGLPDDLVPGLEGALFDFAWLAPEAQGCLIDEEVTEPTRCVFGDPQGTHTVVLLGDSHAAQWLTAFDTLGKGLKWRVIVLAKTSCPAVSLDLFRAFGTGPSRSISAYPECGEWLSSAIQRINEAKPDAVILGSCNGCAHMVDADGNRFTREAWGDGLQRTLDSLGAGPERIVLGDIPRWRGALDCLALNQDDARACSKEAQPVIGETYNDVEERVARASGASFIDPVPWFCSSVCPAIVGNYLTYTNDNHVTATYARYLAPELAALLLPIVEAPDR